MYVKSLVLAMVISASDWKAVRISLTKVAYVDGFFNRRKVAPESRVAVDSDPAMLSEKALTSISARDMPFSSLAASI